MKNDCTASHVTLGAKTGKPPFYFKDVERFGDVGSVNNFIAEQENKATLQKTWDVKLLQTFLQTRNELRKVEENSSIGVKRLHLRVCHYCLKEISVPMK